MKPAILVILLFASTALAGVTSTVSTKTTVMHLEGKASVTLKDSPTLGTAHDQCIRTTSATPGAHTCTDVYSVVTVGTCDDEKAPTIALAQEEIEGKKYWRIPTGVPDPPEPTEANGWAVMVWAYVKNPAANAYPNCWVRGWALEREWELNPNYPNTPQLQRKEPGQPPITEAPADESHDCWPGDTECVPSEPPA